MFLGLIVIIVKKYHESVFFYDQKYQYNKRA